MPSNDSEIALSIIIHLGGDRWVHSHDSNTIFLYSGWLIIHVDACVVTTLITKIIDAHIHCNLSSPLQINLLKWMCWKGRSAKTARNSQFFIAIKHEFCRYHAVNLIWHLLWDPWIISHTGKMNDFILLFFKKPNHFLVCASLFFGKVLFQVTLKF